ncbi:MAG: hypothetical protein CO183_01045 [Candidatus Zambryskibacteria bacterium CG_4_9_14_3_um_filter_42_9]|uniref:Uncharacterized protein n=1 Tax=Candidatus Zambryskibacteria bacterium CG22_combo_CG10-13_8_21_14_all_42_17 TaxID=1975118 RepID=A0A2H0BF84_9BACT|nr:MAG: hypothetical protein COX06_02230 [Candidatus Zambryskibacteria bacterium CG22_combo_CG10-13_8_21_14_all_42_17]PJA36920.1 MAG: hypothetical protein CO183_01045 [Candidatus Zambryskibacteria bacterium CG_4_9_14_3_um_filter_42_9]
MLVPLRPAQGGAKWYNGLPCLPARLAEAPAKRAGRQGFTKKKTASPIRDIGGLLERNRDYRY